MSKRYWEVIDDEFDENGNYEEDTDMEICDKNWGIAIEYDVNDGDEFIETKQHFILMDDEPDHKEVKIYIKDILTESDYPLIMIENIRYTIFTVSDSGKMDYDLKIDLI